MSYNDEYEETGGDLFDEEGEEESFPWSFTETCGEDSDKSDAEEEQLNFGGYGSFIKEFTSEPKQEEPIQQLVSGIGIVEEGKLVSADENTALLAKLNEANSTPEPVKVEDCSPEDEDARRKATERILEERYLQEQEEKAKREEARRLEEEEEALKNQRRREANPFYRIKIAMAKRKQEKDIKKKEEAEALAKNQKKTEPVEKKPEKKREQKKPGIKSEDWEYIATHDRQTGLLNQVALERTAEEIDIGAVLYIAIRDFSFIKEKYDSKTEDDIVKAFATVLKTSYENTAYRVGAGEFVILCNANEKDSLSLQFETFVGKVQMASYSLVVGSSLVNGNLMSAVDKAKADAVLKERLPKPGKSPVVSQDYDALLTKDQRELKEQIQENHTPASRNTTSRIIAEIQSRQNEVNVILIASANFDALFIIRDINTFVRLVIEMDHLIDYSYLYVVYDGGAQYYGTDEYLKKVTNLFEDIAEGVMTRHIVNKKDVANVKGINVFKKIYFE